MIKSFNGKSPRIAPSALILETAYIIGDVEITEKTPVIWPGQQLEPISHLSKQ